MRKRERDALRRSICQGLLDNAYLSLIDRGQYEDQDAWEGDEREWHGPEVMEECRAVYLKLTQAMLEMSPKLCEYRRRSPMARHKWQYTMQPWTATCDKCGCRLKDGRPRKARRKVWSGVVPVRVSIDGGQTWTEGDPPACTGKHS